MADYHSKVATRPRHSIFSSTGIRCDSSNHIKAIATATSLPSIIQENGGIFKAIFAETGNLQDDYRLPMEPSLEDKATLQQGNRPSNSFLTAFEPSDDPEFVCIKTTQMFNFDTSKMKQAANFAACFKMKDPLFRPEP